MAVPNVTYNIDVKSKFALFLDDDLCEAEPDELVRRVGEEKKKRESEIKEARRRERAEAGIKAPGRVEVKEGKTTTDKDVKNSTGLKGKNESVSKGQVKLESSQRNQGKTENAMRTTPKVDSVGKVHGKSDIVPKVYSKIDNVVEEESSDDKSRSAKNKKPFNSTHKTRGREFDRHSGSDKTGVKAVERRDGSGSYNWGNVMDVVDLPTFPDPKEEIIEDKSAVLATSDSGEKKESEKPVMTISEWKALHSNDSNVISSHVPTRPANNGENVFTGMNAYQKKNIHQNESDNEVVIPEDDTDSKGRRQIKVNIEFSGRARRGGRGGFSNPRFKKDDGNKESTKDGVIINLDEEEFPMLS